jgi:protein ImuB
LGRPLVTACPDGQRRVLASIDDAAAKAGLKPGMTVAHAQSVVPGLVVVDATPEEDKAALERLALWCMRYAPLVAPDPPDGIFIDVAGAAHLFRGEAMLLCDLVKRLQAAGCDARASVADTPGCAWAMARFSSQRIVPPGRAADAIASLPLASLRLASDAVDALHQVGIERVAQLAAKPRAAITLRFGAEVLLRLDQAFGSVHELLTSLPLPDVPRVERRFAEPLGDPEDLQRLIAHLCERLCPVLAEKSLGARRLDLLFTRVDGIPQAVRIGLSRPSRDARHFAKLLGERLVLVDPGFGIEGAVLTASWAERLAPTQTIGAHVKGKTSDGELGPLVDTLAVRLGGGRIFRAAPVESEIPERSVGKVLPLAPSKGASWPKHLPRPPRLLTPPEPINAVAEIPDHPPRFFVWRKRRLRVARADGPERIQGEWWVDERETGLVRDYYRVEAEDGQRYWLFRDAPAAEGGRWWLHGIGDA